MSPLAPVSLIALKLFGASVATAWNWPTNAAAHKNHVNSFRALRIYWEELGGGLDCHITGVNTADLLDEDEARAPGEPFNANDRLKRILPLR